MWRGWRRSVTLLIDVYISQRVNCVNYPFPGGLDFLRTKGWETFPVDEPDSRYFRFCNLDGLCYNYSMPLLQCKSSHRQRVNKWAWLCSNKALFMKTGGALDWPVGYSLLVPETDIQRDLLKLIWMFPKNITIKC